MLAGVRIATIRECENFLRRALAALDGAMDGADVAYARGLAGEEQTVLDRLGKNLLSGEPVDGDVAVGAVREGIVAPFVNVGSL